MLCFKQISYKVSSFPLAIPNIENNLNKGKYQSKIKQLSDDCLIKSKSMHEMKLSSPQSLLDISITYASRKSPYMSLPNKSKVYLSHNTESLIHILSQVDDLTHEKMEQEINNKINNKDNNDKDEGDCSEYNEYYEDRVVEEFVTGNKENTLKEKELDNEDEKKVLEEKGFDKENEENFLEEEVFDNEDEETALREIMDIRFYNNSLEIGNL